MATVVNMRDAKSNLSRLVTRAASGEEILIAKNGEPVASKSPRVSNPNNLDILNGRIPGARVSQCNSIYAPCRLAGSIELIHTDCSATHGSRPV